MDFSILEIMKYRRNQSAHSTSLQQSLGLEKGSVKLHRNIFPLSVLIYNMGLLVAPAPYKGTDRDGAISELIKRITDNPPDIVGLCEVFADGERSTIFSRLSKIYPFSVEGPDEADLESDGGLLILSMHRLLAAHQSIYREAAGADWFANKGVLHIRIHPPNSPTPCDIYLSHTQNIEEDGGKEALYNQLTHLHKIVQAYSDPHIPTFIMGDLNIPAENANHYRELITRLGGPVDLWVAMHPGENGATWTKENNFYKDRSDRPKHSERLDYILLKAGTRFIPVPRTVELLKWTRKSRQISDHFGLLVKFEKLLEIEVDLSG